MFKLDNFGVILFVSFSYKKLLQCSFYENLKDWCKNRFFRKKFKKVCVLQRRACNKFKFQTQLSRKLQRFRTCRKNKKCFIFHDLSEYIIFSYSCNLLEWSFNLVFQNISIRKWPSTCFHPIWRRIQWNFKCTDLFIETSRISRISQKIFI